MGDLANLWPPVLSPWQWVAVALVVFVALALVGWLVRSMRRAPPADSILSELSPAALRRLRSADVVRGVGRAFEARGYQVVEPGETGARAEGLLDIELRKERQTWLVSCEHWKSARIDAAQVGAFCAVLKARRAEGGFMVSTGRFSRAAQGEARTVHLTLIDGTRLKALLAAEVSDGAPVARPTAPPAAPRVAAMPEDWEPVSVLPPLPEDLAPDGVALAPPAPGAPPTPACPVCAGPMVMKVAQQGRHAGRGFWACARGRACRGVRPLA
jgi:restriction system protein